MNKRDIEEMVSIAAREAAGAMRQVDIAERMGVTQAYVSKILSGRATLEALTRLVEACGRRIELRVR